MPTYQYKCPECGYEFEAFQSMKDDPIATCPECGGTTRRLISGGAGLLFKGSGFYITDYRSEGYKKSAKTDSGAGAKTSDTTTKSDSKSTSPSKSGGASKSSSKPE